MTLKVLGYLNTPSVTSSTTQCDTRFFLCHWSETRSNLETSRSHQGCGTGFGSRILIVLILALSKANHYSQVGLEGYCPAVTERLVLVMRLPQSQLAESTIFQRQMWLEFQK